MEETAAASIDEKTNLDPYILVAAIDFGTTYSGYGFSFKTTPHDVRANKDWGADVGMQMYKTPTTVLINGTKEFVSFGHTAEFDYSQLSSEESKKYDLFRHFKMILYHDKNISQATKIKSVAGRSHLAIDVFAMAIKFLKDHLIGEISKSLERAPSEKHIKWVLTLPAIWNDKAKQFMREAALKAGLILDKDSKQLVLALEPEAASVLCRSLQVNHFTNVPDEMMETSFEVGTKYMIIDAGGGTVDITTHEVLGNGNIKEISCASGGSWGGNEVNKNFEQLIEKVLGKHFVDRYKIECSNDWLKLMNSFERKKRELNIRSLTKLRIDLPFGIDGKYAKITKKKLDKVINKSVELAFESGCIVMNKGSIAQLFDTVIDKIANHVKHKLQESNNEKVDYMLLVGGFGESKILYDRLNVEFKHLSKVISPREAGLSIIKGAVLFGHNPSVISVRVARKTYGYKTNLQFEEGKHDPVRKYTDEFGVVRCRKGFAIFCEKQELLENNSVKKLSAWPQERSQKFVAFKIYSTDTTNVLYSDDPRLTQIGVITFDIPPLSPDETEHRQFEIEIKFGGTEIEVQIYSKHKDEREIKNLAIDFYQNRTERK